MKKKMKGSTVIQSVILIAIMAGCSSGSPPTVNPSVNSVQTIASFTTDGIGYAMPTAGNVVASYVVPNYPYAVTVEISIEGTLYYTPAGANISHYFALSNGAVEEPTSIKSVVGATPLQSSVLLTLGANFGAFTIYSVLGKSAVTDTCTLVNAVFTVDIKPR